MTERHLDLRVGDPLGCGDHYDLVGVVDGEGRDRRCYAGAEVEEDDLVKAAQEGEQLAVELRGHLCHDGRVGRCGEQMQATGQPRDVRPQLAGGGDALLVAHQVDERERSPTAIGREVGEGPEVRVEVDGERAQPQVAGEDVAGEERTGRLAAAALRGEGGDDVGPRDAWQASQTGLEVRLLALAGSEEQRAQPIAKTGERCVRDGLSVDDGRVVEVVATNPCRLGRHRGRAFDRRRPRVEVGEPHGGGHIVSVWPGKVRSGLPVPIRCWLSSHSRFTSRAVCAVVASDPRWRAAIRHSESPGSTWYVLCAWTSTRWSRVGEADFAAVGSGLALVASLRTEAVRDVGPRWGPPPCPACARDTARGCVLASGRAGTDAVSGRSVPRWRTGLWPARDGLGAAARPVVACEVVGVGGGAAAGGTGAGGGAGAPAFPPGPAPPSYECCRLPRRCPRRRRCSPTASRLRPDRHHSPNAW